MEPSLIHWIALVVGGFPLFALVPYIMDCRGDLGRFRIFIISILMIVLGVWGRLLFENLHETFQLLHEAGKINITVVAKLLASTKLWGEVLSAIYLSLGIGLLVAFFSQKPLASKK